MTSTKPVFQLTSFATTIEFLLSRSPSAKDSPCLPSSSKETRTIAKRYGESLATLAKGNPRTLMNFSHPPSKTQVTLSSQCDLGSSVSFRGAQPATLTYVMLPTSSAIGDLLPTSFAIMNSRIKSTNSTPLSTPFAQKLSSPNNYKTLVAIASPWPTPTVASLVLKPPVTGRTVASLSSISTFASSEILSNSLSQFQTSQSIQASD